MADPILKWAGGKRQITNEILCHFPLDYRNRGYHEPMVGAGALTFLIEPKKGSINDINERLMRLYRVVRDHPNELISQNRKHVHDRDYYYAARKRFNSPLSGENEIDKLLWSATRSPPPVRFTCQDNKKHKRYNPRSKELWYLNKEV